MKTTWLIISFLCVVGISGNSQVTDGFTPRDQWRVIDGTPNYAKGDDWVEFAGKVLEIQPGKGVRLEGNYNRIGSGATMYYTGNNYSAFNYEFFVANFPYDVAEGDIISVADRFTAHKTSTYTYKTTAGGSRTIRQIDYGTPYAPPALTPEQIAAAKAAQEKANVNAKANAAAQKQATADRALKFNQDAAAKGDMFGLLRMGERYRDGDGVEKDLAKAKEYLQKAADAGSPTAKEELSKLNQP
jgi:TPR repeat protein